MTTITSITTIHGELARNVPPYAVIMHGGHDITWHSASWEYDLTSQMSTLPGVNETSSIEYCCLLFLSVPKYYGMTSFSSYNGLKIESVNDLTSTQERVPDFDISGLLRILCSSSFSRLLKRQVLISLPSDLVKYFQHIVGTLR